MSELKKLIINGQEYTITDGGAVVFDEPQTLTDEQKAQARENIGADGTGGVSVTHSWDGTTLIVTSASGTSSADLKGEKGETGPTGPQGPQGEKGDKGDTGDPGLTWRGTWNEEMHSGSASGAGYTNGDVVYHNGSAYVFANESNPESEPGVEDSVWSLLAAKGDTGEQGIQGEKGEKGDTGATGAAGADGATVAEVLAALSTETWTFTLADGSTVDKVVPLV